MGGQDHPYETAKTAVFWDMVACPIPDGLNADLVSRNIRSSLEKAKYRGRSTIYGFGDRNLNQQGLASAGIIFDHIPGGDRDTRLDRIMLAFFRWALEHPPPGNVMLIIGDLSGRRELESAFILLHYSDYNVLLAQPRNASGPLGFPITTKWLWESLPFGIGKAYQLAKPPMMKPPMMNEWVFGAEIPAKASLAA